MTVDLPKFPVEFVPRQTPLSSRAVVGVQDVGRAFAQRVLRLDDAQLRTLHGVCTRGVVVFLGVEQQLPWVDGVLYLGVAPEAPSLLLPTHLAPSVHPSLFERAIARHVRSAVPPLVVLPSPRLIVSVAQARPVHRTVLSQWLQEQR